MLTLSLLRHAKSSWDDPTQSDHERGLNGRGHRDAPRVGRYISANRVVPDLVLCSDAVRTRETMRLVLAEWGEATPPTLLVPGLYLAEPAGILKAVSKVAASVGHCMVIGHNPGLHALAGLLVESGEPHALADLAAKFPTAAFAVIDLPATGWAKVKPATGRLRLFVTPKSL